MNNRTFVSLFLLSSLSRGTDPALQSVNTNSQEAFHCLAKLQRWFSSSSVPQLPGSSSLPQLFTERITATSNSKAALARLGGPLKSRRPRLRDMSGQQLSGTPLSKAASRSPETKKSSGRDTCGSSPGH